MAETTPQEDITQQATAPTSKKKPATAKNPKRVAAGKMVAERTRRAREAQKKAAEEGAAIIANQKAEEPSPQESEHPVEAPQAASEYSSLTTTQWLALGSFVVSLIGLYYKRKEIKNLLSKKPPQAPVEVPPPAKAPYDRPVTSRGLRNMD